MKSSAFSRRTISLTEQQVSGLPTETGVEHNRVMRVLIHPATWQAMVCAEQTATTTGLKHQPRASISAYSVR